MKEKHSLIDEEMNSFGDIRIYNTEHETKQKRFLSYKKSLRTLGS